MKKLLSVLFLCLSACMAQYDKAPAMKDYTQVPLLELPVSRVSIISQANQSERLPHVENQMQMTPEKALKNWALVRLRPDYKTTDKAEFVITQASMEREDAPTASFFTYNNYKYNLNYTVVLRILNKDAEPVRTIEVSGFASRELPQKASIEQRDNMFAHLLLDMEEQLDSKFPEEIKLNLLDLQ